MTVHDQSNGISIQTRFTFLSFKPFTMPGYSLSILSFSVLCGNGRDPFCSNSSSGYSCHISKQSEYLTG